MRILDYLFFILLGLIIILISIIHNIFSKVISIINQYGGLFTFISVIIVLVLFIIEKSSENKRKNAEQNNILRNLKFELKKIKQDSDGYQKSFFDGTGFPFYSIKELNKSYYLHNIDETLVKLNDKEFKDKISTISDKIILLNRYLDYIMRDFNRFLAQNNIKEFTPTTTNKFIKTSVIYHYWRSSTKTVKKDMDEHINNILKTLNKY